LLLFLFDNLFKGPPPPPGSSGEYLFNFLSYYKLINKLLESKKQGLLCSKLKLKAFFWDPLPPTKLENTFWSSKSIDEKYYFDMLNQEFETFEQLFTVQQKPLKNGFFFFSFFLSNPNKK